MGEGANGISERILCEVLALGPRIGKLEAAQELSNAHLAAIDRRLEAGSSQMHGYGTDITKCEGRLDRLEQGLEETRTASAQRHHKISEQLTRLGLQWEDTGVHEIERLKAEAAERKAAEAALDKDRSRRWQRFAWLVGTALTICGLLKAGQCAVATRAAQPAPADAAVQAARR